MFRPNLVSRSIGIGISLAVVGFLLLGIQNQAKPGVAVVAMKPGVATKGLISRIGNDSCVARGCHGKVGLADAKGGHLYLKGGEATTWATFDPHSRAYDVLSDARSKRIAKLLAAELGGKQAHEAKLCLDCHSIGGEPDNQAGKNDFAAGVDCETCHGAASAWLEPHLTNRWPASTDKEKESLGFRPLVELSSRAKLCVTCHVGDATKQVNHDLIAAGHPRLIFELSAYQNALPRHWLEPHEKPDATTKAGDFHARSWAAGQVATVLAGLDLLKARADSAQKGHAPWPEFTEHDCFACHHQLSKPAWRQDDPARRPAGSLPWGSWTIPTTSALARVTGGEGTAKVLSMLRAEMSRPLPDPTRVSGLAAKASKSVQNWQGKPGALRLDAPKLKTLLCVFLDANAKPLNWDEAAARSLAARSLMDSWTDVSGRPIDPAWTKQAEKLGGSLSFPNLLDSPQGFRP